MLFQILIGVALAVLIVGLAAIAERRSCKTPRDRDFDNHGSE